MENSGPQTGVSAITNAEPVVQCIADRFPLATDPNTASIDEVLRAICIASSDAWCFAPTGSALITHCSQEFLRWFGIEDAAIPAESGVAISVHDPRISRGCQKLGLDSAWIRQQLQLAAHLDQASNTTTVNHTSWQATRKIVSGHDGSPCGIMLLFRENRDSASYKAIWNRAVEARQDLKVLSPRESEILSLISTGLTNKAVARSACISEKTVEKHRANIMRKLGVGSAAGLIRRVTEASLLAEDETD